MLKLYSQNWSISKYQEEVQQWMANVLGNPKLCTFSTPAVANLLDSTPPTCRCALDQTFYHACYAIGDGC